VIDKLIVDLNEILGVTSVVVSHDIESSFKIADWIMILFFGKKIAEGTPEEIQNSEDPRVQQFIKGSKDFYEDILIP